MRPSERGARGRSFKKEGRKRKKERREPTLSSVLCLYVGRKGEGFFYAMVFVCVWERRERDTKYRQREKEKAISQIFPSHPADFSFCFARIPELLS